MITSARSRRCLRWITLALLLWGTSRWFESPASAIGRRWTGTASNFLWSVANNWDPPGPPQDGDALALGGLSTNDLPGLRPRSLTAGIGFTTLHGRGLTLLNSGIVVAQDGHLTIHCDITLGADQEFRLATASSADLKLTGGLHLNGFDLTLNLYSRFGALALSNVIDGIGNIRVRGDFLHEFSRVELGAPGLFNAFDGTVTIDSGLLNLRGSEPLGTGGLVLNGGRAAIVDGTSARPLIYGQDFDMIAMGDCHWRGPIHLNDTALGANSHPFSYFSSSNRLIVSGPLIGPTNASLTFFGAEVELAGSAPDQFAGELFGSCDRLLLHKSGGARLGARSLSIGGQCEVRWLASNQLAGGAVSMFGGQSFVNLNGFSDSIGALTTIAGSIQTGAGELTLLGPVTHLGDPFGAERLFFEGHLRLPSGFRTFEVQESRSRLNEVVIAAQIHGPGSLVKSGDGTLWLTGNNDYAGLTLINEGMLAIAANNALGSASSGTLVQDGATLSLRAFGGTLAEPISLRGAGLGGTNGALQLEGTLSVTLRNPTPSIFPCLDLITNGTVRIEAGASLTADGFISGFGPLTKTGPGRLVLANANANTYVGDTIISEGLLELRKPNALAVPGNLILGPAPAGRTAVARLLQFGGIRPSALVTANAGALFDLNGTNQTLAGLNLSDGGSVDTGIGKLVFTAGARVRAGSQAQATPGFNPGCSIRGQIELPPNVSVTFEVAAFASNVAPASPDLDVPAAITFNGREDSRLGRAGLSKTGPGRMRVSGTNPYFGSTTIGEGTLEIAGTQLNSPVQIAAGARLQGNGVLGRVLPAAGSTLGPGPNAGVGLLTCSNFNSAGSGGTLQLDCKGLTRETGYDRLDVRGTVRLTGITLQAKLDFLPLLGDQLTVLVNDGTDPIVDTFLGLPQGARFHLGGHLFTISYTGGTGNDVVLTHVTTPPRPTLTIQPLPPGSVQIFWPTNAVGYRLQSNTNLAGPNWDFVPTVPIVVGSNLRITSPATNDQQFYRLFAP